jgi:Protein of unknown function (DUF3574)
VKRIVLCVFTALALSACGGMPVSSCAVGAQALVQDQLYFGLSVPDGGQISLAQWQAFLRDEVTPRFPQGLSVVEAAGQWRGNDGSIVQENSRVLTLVHADDKPNEAAIQAIMASYKSRFSQEAVMRLKQRACTSF